MPRTIKQYPLGDTHAELCENARFVGGVSRYLCECLFPCDCPGWQAAEKAGATVYVLNPPASKPTPKRNKTAA